MPTHPGRSLERSMNLSIAGGAAGTIWMIACAPQAIFNVFVGNGLGATSTQLGVLVGLLSLASIMQVPSILIYRRLRRRKPFWIVTSVIHRLNGPVLAAVAFGVARGGDRSQGITVVFVAMTISWIVTNLSSSGWWSWMADLVPIDRRARFFGRRSAVAQVVNVVAFFFTSVALDGAMGERQFLVYGVVFAVAGIGGLADILLHIPIPESQPAEGARDEGAPVPTTDEASDEASAGDVPLGRAPKARSGRNGPSMTAPLTDRNFRRFSIITGVVLFSINVSAPFFAPYVTDPTQIGAPNTWLGIMFVLSQLTWIVVAPAWGTIMDRFGRKPVVMIGLLFTLSWIGYLVLTPHNYVVVLPIIAMAGGVLAPAFWDGINQLMLSLTRRDERITYIAWYWMIIGTISSGGSVVGGMLDDRFAGRMLHLGVVTVGGFQVVVLASLALVGLSIAALSRIDEGPAKPVGFVFSRVASPGIFRTFLNIGVLSRTDRSDRVVRTLRSIDSASDDIAADQVLGRVNDPDPEVREEAVRALGRLRSVEAMDALVELLRDPDSGARVAAARALGRIRNEEALPHLVEAMQGAPDELRAACAAAVGEIGGGSSLRVLAEILRADTSDTVAAGGASALSMHGAFEAAWEIVPRLHRTRNPVLRTQLAIAVANVLGRPGEFYRYVTGSEEQQRMRRRRLVGEAIRGAKTVLGSTWNGELERAIRTGDPRTVLGALHRAAHDLLCWRYGYEAGRNRDNRVDHDTPAPRSCDADLVLKRVYDADPRLGLWYWFLGRAVNGDMNGETNGRRGGDNGAPPDVRADAHGPTDPSETSTPSGTLRAPENLTLELLIALYYLKAVSTVPTTR